MHIKNGTLLSVGIMAALVVSAGHAFFDEIDELRSELQVWQTTHAADFTDVIAQLGDITGPVFRDVDSAAWYNPYVSSLAEWGIVSGYRDTAGRFTGEFKPANNVTIAEALKMAMEAAQVDRSICAQVAPAHPQAQNHWSKDYVSCAEQMKVRLVVSGADLDRPASRAEVLTIVLDVFQDQALPLYSNYNDTAGHVYERDIAYATLSGIVNGDTDRSGTELGTFRPDDKINRAETAKIIYERLKVDVRSA